MRIVWDARESCFETLFASGEQWAADQQLAKDAGFKTNGAEGGWRWFANTVKPLNYLKEHRPVELAISTDALNHYQRLQAMHEANEAVLAPLREIKKQTRKRQVKEKREGEKFKLIVPEKGYIGAEDLPPLKIELHCYPKPAPFDVFCSVCQAGLDDIWDDRVFRVCLYCEKESEIQ